MPINPQVLTRLLNNDPELQALCLYNTGLITADITALTLSLANNTMLVSLDISGNCTISFAGIVILVQTLETNTTLLLLNIGNCGIDFKGATALAGLLKVNTVLASLIMCHNDIGVEGIKAIADALKKNTTLSMLNLNHINVGFTNAKNFLATVFDDKAANTALLKLTMNFYGFSELDKQKYQALLIKNHIITRKTQILLRLILTLVTENLNLPLEILKIILQFTFSNTLPQTKLDLIPFALPVIKKEREKVKQVLKLAYDRRQVVQFKFITDHITLFSQTNSSVLMQHQFKNQYINQAYTL